MKKYIKNILATTLISTAFIVSANVQTIFADETNKFNAVGTEVLSGETFVIDDQGKLWVNNEVYQFNEVTDNTVQVFETFKEDTCLILKKDGTLFYAVEIRGIATDENGENIFNNKWKFYEVAKNVKDVNYSELEEENYVMSILKTDNTIYQVTEPTKYFENIVSGVKTEQMKVVATNVKTMGTDYDKDIYYVTNDGGLYRLKNLYKDEITETLYSTPVRVAGNVKDIKIDNGAKVIIANNGYVYNINESDEYYYDYYYYNDVENDNEIDKQYLQIDDKFKDTLEPRFITDNAKSIVSVGSYNDLKNIYIIKNDNTLWGYGQNSFGQLGFENEEKEVYDEYSQESYTEIKSFYTEPVKIDDNVVDVASYGDCTVYTTIDGKLMATGDISYGQIAKDDVNTKIYQDENGYYEVVTGAKDISLSYGESLIVKEDNSLWSVGYKGETSYNNEEDDDAGTMQKVADNVNWAKTDEYSNYYTTGEKNELYRKYNSKVYADQTIYELGLLGIKVSDKDKADIYSGAYNFDAYYEKLGNLSEEKGAEFYRKTEEFMYELEIKYEYITDDVIYASDGYYLTSDNVLYKINYYADNTEIAKDIKSFHVDYNLIYAIDVNDNVKIGYYGNIGDSIAFKDAKITNAKEVNSDDIYYNEYTVFVLDNDNSLWKYTDIYNAEEYVDDLTSVFSSETKELVAKNVSSFDVTPGGVVYVVDGVLYGLGSNKDDQFGYTYEESFDKPYEIMSDVKKVEASNGYYGKTLVLKNDGTVISMGKNEYGELGFEPTTYADRPEAVSEVFEVNTNR